ncbi:hypothetical protein [Cystobacter ferrugineus]|uniref:Uncharacterized protein n=1 Tax=Cystobacter ferrugineus TaxID=83449 RepID=A0A1L9BEX6_9BACT|nr:hypothetical protein [Cystobacter ferrugineus]OJH40785.1 hypothetical protein BON30_07540 [Cystobacter ferrugineus]
MAESPENTSPALTLLERARHHVRTRSRSAAYYQSADRFSEVFLGKTFQVEPDYYRAVGTDYSAIDWLYEELGQDEALTREALDAVTDQLQEMTRPGPARAALEPLQAALHAPSCSLLDVCRALLGAITVLGEDSLGARGFPAALVRDWLALWSDRVWRQNSQQARLTLLIQVMRASPEDRPGRLAALGDEQDALSPRGTHFEQGVHEYLERYAETGASSVALVGGLPFARALTPRDLEKLLGVLREGSDFLGGVARLLRFAQDVRFDPSEPLNSGVMGYAAEQRQRLTEINATRLPREELDTRLKREWADYSARLRQELDAVVAGLGDEPLRPLLQTFVQSVWAISTRLAEAGHDPRPGT